MYNTSTFCKHSDKTFLRFKTLKNRGNNTRSIVLMRLFKGFGFIVRRMDMRRLLVYDTLEGVVFLIGREKIASLVQLPSNLSCRKHLFLVCTLRIWLFRVNSSYFIRKSKAENAQNVPSFMDN